MIENSILRKNRQGLKAVALTLTFASTEIVEMAARAGFDAIHLDGEHGAFGPEAVDLICRVANGCGLSVTARVPDIAPSTINLYLDRGAQGITGPHVESGAEAQQLADAFLYPPDGRRSWGWGRGTDFNEETHLSAVYGGKLSFARWANANTIVAAQIESKAGYENLDAILAVKGLTEIAGGPNDFAASLGHPGNAAHPERVRLTAEVEVRTRAAGKAAASDLVVGITLHDFFLGHARAFVAQHTNTPIGA